MNETNEPQSNKLIWTTAETRTPLAPPAGERPGVGAASAGTSAAGAPEEQDPQRTQPLPWHTESRATRESRESRANLAVSDSPVPRPPVSSRTSGSVFGSASAQSQTASPAPASSRIPAAPAAASATSRGRGGVEELSLDPIASVSTTDDGFLFGDPLVGSPRTSTIVLNLVFCVLFLLGFVGVYWLGVRTADGQRYDDLVWQSLQESGAPSVLDSSANPLSFAYSPLVIGVSAAFALAALIVAAVRRRWWLIGQLVVFGAAAIASAEGLKKFLPRERLDPMLANPANTLPSGHTVLAAAAGVALLFALPRVVRWVGALVGALFAVGVGVAVVVGQWHRPSDVVAALMLVAALGFLTLAFTHGSGMDQVGTRRSSVPLQIVAPVMIAAGVMGQLVVAYLIWQLQPGLALQAQWALQATQVSSIVMIASTASLMFGLLAAMRQISACPLSKAGRVGEPPAPPQGADRANAIEVGAGVADARSGVASGAADDGSLVSRGSGRRHGRHR